MSICSFLVEISFFVFLHTHEGEIVEGKFMPASDRPRKREFKNILCQFRDLAMEHITGLFRNVVHEAGLVSFPKSFVLFQLLFCNIIRKLLKIWGNN